MCVGVVVLVGGWDSFSSSYLLSLLEEAKDANITVTTTAGSATGRGRNGTGFGDEKIGWEFLMMGRGEVACFGGECVVCSGVERWFWFWFGGWVR